MASYQLGLLEGTCRVTLTSARRNDLRPHLGDPSGGSVQLGERFVDGRPKDHDVIVGAAPVSFLTGVDELRDDTPQAGPQLNREHAVTYRTLYTLVRGADRVREQLPRRSSRVPGRCSS